MKKIFILFLFSSISLSQLFGIATKQELELAKNWLEQKIEERIKNRSMFQNFTSSISNFAEKFSGVPGKVKATFNWAADHIDKILTKKGAINTLLILSPLFAIYCCFFPPAPVQSLINRIVSSTTQGSANIAKATLEGLRNNKADLKALVVDVMREVGDVQATVKINQEIGEMKAFGASMWTDPIFTGLLGAYRVIQNGVAIGIPFILGLWMQNKFKLPVSQGVPSSVIGIQSVSPK